MKCIEYYNLNLNKPIMTVQSSNEITITIINMGRKFGGLHPLFAEGVGPHAT